MSDSKRSRDTGNFYRKARKYEQYQDAAEPAPGPSRASFETPVPSVTAEMESYVQEDIVAPDFSNVENEEPIVRDYLFDDDDDDDAEDVRPIEGMSITDGIRYWALSTNASYRSINMVLRLFQQAHVKAPSTAKTLLKTDRSSSTQIAEIGGGHFWYRGIKRCLQNYFRTEKSPATQLSLTISIDGLPLHTNSSIQFWPILFSIHELPQAPVMTAGIFCGTTKPESAEEYLRPMVVEMNDLMQRGIIVHGCHVAIRLRAIVADTPARAFIKGIKGHTGYDSCLKCTVVGKYSQAGRTMTFPGTNAQQRTDKCFRDNAYPGHRKTEKPFGGFAVLQHHQGHTNRRSTTLCGSRCRQALYFRLSGLNVEKATLDDKTMCSNIKPY
ncbi:uncharacterized protein LOC118512676 [Anopheles stephensi]|uniref:uncharacterized protein LOC118512676 n=1 Tax=Anopheles stephensi TaxID=30069 RepID=UPI001658C161|nr:uncharacterized protein LOC118512676 [Anopheles stephensi]